MKKTNKKTIRWVVFFVIVFGVVYLYRQPVLQGMGAYLAPSEPAEADAVIVEGNATLQTVAVDQAMGLLKTGKVKKIVIVIHRLPPGEDIFALPNYHRLITEKLSQKGLRSGEFDVMDVPVKDPVTLSEAAFVMAKQSKEGVRHAVLMAQGFHMRRSLLAYRNAGKSMDVKILPAPYYAGYRPDAWWLTTDGCRDFASETLKFLYYILRGHIPLRSLVTLNI